MNTSSELTILIPTHNRHNYLLRALAYYSNWQYSVIILDSTNSVYSKSEIPAIVKYHHLPGMSLPEKLSYGFSRVLTDFVVMCADDDFLVCDGVRGCLEFLQKNREYSSADGGILFYKKKDIFKNEVNYNLLYKKGLDVDFSSSDSLERLRLFFDKYRTLFYGVHYTKNLRTIYESCWHSIKNLYLNEYLTALLPIVNGYCRILPIVTAVRESTITSDDKTTINLDSMFGNPQYEPELRNYIECVSQVIHNECSIPIEKCKTAVTDVLQNYAQTIPVAKNNEQQYSNSMTKKIGMLLLKIPYLGPLLVRKRRRKQSEVEIAALIKTSTDRSNLQRISQCILQYKSIC